MAPVYSSQTLRTVSSGRRLWSVCCLTAAGSIPDLTSRNARVAKNLASARFKGVSSIGGFVGIRMVRAVFEQNRPEDQLARSAVEPVANRPRQVAGDLNGDAQADTTTIGDLVDLGARAQVLDRKGGQCLGHDVVSR